MENPVANTPIQRSEAQIHARSIKKGNGLLLASLIAFLLFGLMAFLIRGLAPLSVDLAITQTLQSLTLAPHVFGRPIPIYHELMLFVSLLGYWPYNFFIGAALVGILLLRRLFVEAVVLVVSAAGVGIIVALVKGYFERPRPSLPYVNVVYPVDGYSFPSGHVAGYVCEYGFIFYLAWTFVLTKPGWVRNLTLILTGALIALVGVSRIYLGHHWASDVLGGYALGFGWLCLCIWAYRQWQVHLLSRTVP